MEAAITDKQSINSEGNSPLTTQFAFTVEQGNLLIAVFVSRNSGTISAPAGWSTASIEDGVSPSVAMFYKIAGAGESRSVTVTTTASG